MDRITLEVIGSALASIALLMGWDGGNGAWTGGSGSADRPCRAIGSGIIIADGVSSGALKRSVPSGWDVILSPTSPNHRGFPLRFPAAGLPRRPGAARRVAGGHCGATADQERRAPFTRESASGPTILAELLRRVFAIQVLVCERCGGPRRILGAVTEPHAVRRGLAALGLAAEPPPGIPVGARA
jgi:hypothetical protein